MPTIPPILKYINPYAFDTYETLRAAAPDEADADMVLPVDPIPDAEPSAPKTKAKES